MDKCVVGVPWLEKYCEGGEPEQYPLHSFPFSIGRVESADLQIEDTRVSREHAVILREGKTFRIRDLHSTNGTIVNGQKVQDVELVDGDILVIAGAEFTFYAERSGSSYSTVTERLDGHDEPTATEDRARQIIRHVRRLQQSLVGRAVDVHFRPIVDLASGATWGYEASRTGEEEEPASERLVLASASRITGKLYPLARKVAVEEALRYDVGEQLFLRVETSEIGSDALPDSLARLAQSSEIGPRLVVEIEETGVSDIPYFQSLRSRLRELGIRTAYHGFAGAKSHVTERREMAPDFLMLARSLTAGIHRNHDRQKHVQTIVHACQDMDCRVIATGLASEDDVQLCREFGCPYGLGDALGRSVRPIALKKTVPKPSSEAPHPRS